MYCIYVSIICIIFLFTKYSNNNCASINVILAIYKALVLLSTFCFEFYRIIIKCFKNNYLYHYYYVIITIYIYTYIH